MHPCGLQPLLAPSTQGFQPPSSSSRASLRHPDTDSHNHLHSFPVPHSLHIPPPEPNRFPSVSPPRGRGTEEQLPAVRCEVTAFVVPNVQFEENDTISNRRRDYPAVCGGGRRLPGDKEPAKPPPAGRFSPRSCPSTGAGGATSDPFCSGAAPFPAPFLLPGPSKRVGLGLGALPALCSLPPPPPPPGAAHLPAAFRASEARSPEQRWRSRAAGGGGEAAGGGRQGAAAAAASPPAAPRSLTALRGGHGHAPPFSSSSSFSSPPFSAARRQPSPSFPHAPEAAGSCSHRLTQEVT